MPAWIGGGVTGRVGTCICVAESIQCSPEANTTLLISYTPAQNQKFKVWGKKDTLRRAFRYDLNQIPYDYTVEVRNRFKGLDLIDRLPDELWNEICDIVQESEIKTIPMEKKWKKAKWLSWEALQIAVKKSPQIQRKKYSTKSNIHS